MRRWCRVRRALGRLATGGAVVAAFALSACEPVPAGGEVVLESGPPPPLVESPTPSPYPGGVWIAGHWYWAGDRYAWAPGYWHPPRAGYVWIQPRWHHGRRWVYQRGYWRHW